jgi:hypothetical protein
MRMTGAVAGVLFCLAAGGAWAIDREARSVETAGFEMANYRDLDYAGVRLDVENLLAAESEKWALLAGVSGGRFKPDTGDRVYTGLLTMGIRHYLLPVTALSLTGSYRTDDSRAFKVAAGTAGLKQRFLPASRAISPWVAGRISVQDVNLSKGFLSARERSYTAVVTTLEVGCDFMMDERFAFVFHAGASETETVQSGASYADGIYGGIALRYYWK